MAGIFGDFKAQDGSDHYSQTDAELHDAISKSEGKGSGGGNDKLMNGMIKIFFIIIIFGPIVFAKVIGFIWGLLLKLPTVGKVNIGKIITTILMVIAGPMMVMIFMGLADSLFRSMGAIGSDIMIFGSALLIPVWYFCWHYDVVKQMGATVFSEKIKKLAMFVWFGFIGALIIGGISGSDTTRGVISMLATIAGIVYYLKTTQQYAEAAKEANPNQKTAVKYMALLVAAGLTVLLVVGNIISRGVDSVKAKAEYAKLEKLRADPKGQILTVSEVLFQSGFSPSIYAEPSASSKFVNTIKGADTIKATGKIEKGVWIPVDVDGEKGYVFAPYLRLGKEALFDNYPYEATANDTIELYAMSGIFGNYFSSDSIEPGETVTIITAPSGGSRMDNSYYSNFYVKKNGTQYEAFGKDAEKLIPKLNADGSLVKK